VAHSCRSLASQEKWRLLRHISLFRKRLAVLKKWKIIVIRLILYSFILSDILEQICMVLFDYFKVLTEGLRGSKKRVGKE
jgi:hypothetical protein